LLISASPFVNIVTVVSISLTPELGRRLDEFREARGYSSRSEVVRLAIRELLARDQIERAKGHITSTITVISRHTEDEFDAKLFALRHRFNQIVSSDLHMHLGEDYCLEVFVTQGRAKEVGRFIDQLRMLNNIEQVVYTIAPLSEEECPVSQGI